MEQKIFHYLSPSVVEKPTRIFAFNDVIVEKIKEELKSFHSLIQADRFKSFFLENVCKDNHLSLVKVVINDTMSIAQNIFDVDSADDGMKAAGIGSTRTGVGRKETKDGKW